MKKVIAAAWLLFLITLLAILAWDAFVFIGLGLLSMAGIVFLLTSVGWAFTTLFPIKRR